MFRSSTGARALWEKVKTNIFEKEEHDCSSNESVCQIMEKVAEMKEIVMKIQHMIGKVPSEQANIIPDTKEVNDDEDDVQGIPPKNKDQVDETLGSMGKVSNNIQIEKVPSEQPNILPDMQTTQDSVGVVPGIPPENENIGTVPSKKPNMMTDMKEVHDGVEDFTGLPPENKDQVDETLDSMGKVSNNIQIEKVPSKQPNILPDMQTTQDSVGVVPGIPPENENIGTVPPEQPNIIPDMQKTKDSVGDVPGIPPANEDIAPTSQQEGELEKGRKLSECIQALLSACDQINVLYYQMKHKKEDHPFYIIDPSPSQATSRFTDALLLKMKQYKIEVYKMKQMDDIKYTDALGRVLVICSLTSRADCNMEIIQDINPQYHFKIVLVLLHCTTKENLPSHNMISEAKKKYPNITKVVEMAFYETIYSCSMNSNALAVLLNKPF